MILEQQIQPKTIIRYALLPGIIPRLKKLLGSGLDYIPYFIVVVFNTLRIIPSDHPYMRRTSQGRFSVFQALAVAADHITFDRKNIDKVAIFFTVITGLVMLILQFILFIITIFTGRAFAYDGPGQGPTTFGEFFNNPNPGTDIAYQILNMVFGMPDIFNTGDGAATDSSTVTPFHQGLHALLQFYSFGLVLVGTFVIIYLTIAIVLETAQSGTPFGERFNKAWAPIRLILFFGLLLPAPSGLNLGQYLVLEAAKLGSNLATNAWLGFDKAVGDSKYLGPSDQLISQPNTPDLTSLVSFMQIAKTCSWAEGRINGRDIKPYAVFGSGDNAEAIDISPSSPPSYTDLSKKADGGSIFIRFGVHDSDKYKNETGNVSPFCGELMFDVVDQAQPGSTYVQQAYLELVDCMWYGHKTGGSMDAIDTSWCSATMADERGKAYTQRYSITDQDDHYPDMKNLEGHNAKIGEIRVAAKTMEDAVKKAHDKQVQEGDWINDVALKKGWAGAGIWFNKIAEQNGAFSSAVFDQPQIKLLPAVMEFVKHEKLKENASTPVEDYFTPTLSSGKEVEFQEPQEREVLLVLEQLLAFWGSENSVSFVKDIPETHASTMSGNTIIDIMNVFMGTRGLFDMCNNTDVHPLAQLASLGKGLVDHAIRAFVMAVFTGVGGGLATLGGASDIGAALQAAASFFTTFGAMGLMVGFLLYYVIPLLPFIYFFFAVMTWVKGIFEAMVGLPLWALAHLNIDGEGMPGDAASAGYFYILEIFLRPICILIGLLGGIAIFGAMVKVLNQVFYLALSNLAGHDVKDGTGCFHAPGETANFVESQFLGGTIDQFFYTVMYAIIVYIFATPCFKMVDSIPDNIMRWMGAGIQSFGARDGDDVQGLMGHVSLGVGLVGSGLSGIGGSLKGGINSASNLFGFDGPED